MEIKLDKSKEKDPRDKKPKKQGIYIFILLLLSYISFNTLFKDIGLEELYQALKDLRLTMVFLAFLSMFTYISCEAINFKIVLDLLGEERPFIQILKYSFVGFYFSSITPSASGGQPMQLYYMKKDRIDLSKGSLTVLIILITYQIIMLVYASMAIVSNLLFLMGEIPRIYPLIIFGFITNLLVMGLILLSMFTSNFAFNIFNFFINLLYRLKIIKNMEEAQRKTVEQINRYKEGALIIRDNPRAILLILLVTFIQHSANYSVTYFVYRALGLRGISFWTIVGLQAISYIASSSIPLPGSVGVAETASLLILNNIFPVNLLTRAILIIRLIGFYAMTLITGIFAFLLQFLYRKKDRSAS